MPAARFARAPQRAAIQMVFQDPTDSLNPRFTARETIAEPLALLGPLRGAAAAARVDEVAAQVGLPAALLSRYPHQLSGGQKARVGIARALALRPRLLILDEPTAALDVSVQAVVLQLLDQLRRELGLTLLFVSHDLNVVRLLTDRVAVMYLGKHRRDRPVGAGVPRAGAPVHAGAGVVRSRARARASSSAARSASPIDPPGRLPLPRPLPAGRRTCAAARPRPTRVLRDSRVACHFAA